MTGKKNSHEKYESAKRYRQEDKMGRTGGLRCSGGNKCRIKREQWHEKHWHTRDASGSSEAHPFIQCLVLEEQGEESSYALNASVQAVPEC